MNPKYLLRVNIPPSLEEEFLDALLEKETVTGYQAFNTTGHGQVGSMTVAEQVAGRRNRVQFEVVLEEEILGDVLDHLKSEFPNPDIVYWVLPVIDSGRFG